MQQPKRFQAPTLAEAYGQVRGELGESAVILSTRKAFAPGLFGQPGRQFVEVVARIPEAAPDAPSWPGEARPTLEQDTAAHDLVRAAAEAAATGTVAGTDTEAATVAATPVGAASAIEAGELPVGAASWGRQLDQMRGMLEQLLAERMDARMEEGPAPLRSIRDRLVRYGLPASLASALLSEEDAHAEDAHAEDAHAEDAHAEDAHAEDAHAEDEASLAEAVERRLMAKLPPVPTLDLARRRTVFLLGPSGAGKTTLAVRLALQLQREGMHVVIAGTDVNRAGAPQQLLAFGAATGIEVRLCYAPDELAEVVADPAVDAVIVDTPGHNGQRRDRMAELEAFLQAVRQRSVLLALPATMKGTDLTETVAAFSGAGVDGLVLTRCDETVHYGAMAAVAVEAAIGVAFTTHSDQVSDAAVPGDNAALAAATVRAGWPSPSSASAAAEVEGAGEARDETPRPAGRPTGGARRRLARVG